MAKSLVVWEGLDEYYAELRNMPKACTGEAQRMAEATVNAVTHEIRAAYPARTGKTLRDKTTVVPLKVKGEFVAGAMVRNSSKLATVFENGTQARHTKLGANRGSMPPGHVFVPRIVKARRALTQQWKDMVARQTGATVTGD
jgi:hypothetical protein